MNLSEGQFLCKEGEVNNNLYIVKDGILRGSSTKANGETAYGPGSLIGEFSLLEGSPCSESIVATEDSVLQAISSDALKDALKDEPNWLRSILTFLTGRYHVAEENYRKNVKVMALPALLFLIKSELDSNPAKKIPAEELFKSMEILANLGSDETRELLQSLNNLDVLKFQNNEIRVESPRVITLLYETIQYRARLKKVSPNILSLTEQMILTAITKAVRESHEPLVNSTCTVSTDIIKDMAKKAMHGMTVTLLTIKPLVERKLIQPSIPVDFGDPTISLESIPKFSVDFERILDMLELNRIFPLLNKHLV